MKIKKVYYRRKMNSKEVLPFRKVVLEKVRDNAFLVREYGWSRELNKWFASSKTAYFNGKELVNTGKLVVKTISIIEYFELLVKYEDYSYMSNNEEDESAEAELKYLEEINNTEEN